MTYMFVVKGLGLRIVSRAVNQQQHVHIHYSWHLTSTDKIRKQECPVHEHCKFLLCLLRKRAVLYSHVIRSILLIHIRFKAHVILLSQTLAVKQNITYWGKPD